MFLRSSQKLNYLLQLLHKANNRGLTTHVEHGAVLERWLNSWVPTPPVSYLPGTEPPTALSWLRRRGPAALPDALLHKLFRQEVVRAFDPATGKVSRVARARQLPQGAQLLIPQAAVAEAHQQAQEQERQRQRGGGRKMPDALSAEQQELRAGWVRELRRRVLYQDADLIAVDKPAGLAVQGGSGVAISVDDIMGMAFSRLVADPSDLRLVHRLDQATTGVLVIAKSPDAAAWLSRAFRSSSASAAERAPTGAAPEVRKTYYAIVVKQLPRDIPEAWDEATVSMLADQGEVDIPVAPRRDAGRSGGWGGRGLGDSGGGGADGRAAAAGGRPALTKYTLRRQNEQLAWLELRPQTGRKHQLRIHCAQGLGVPILGDSKYGAVRAPAQQLLLEQLREKGAWPEESRPPMFLHCRSVLIKKPGQEPIRIVAPPHPHWQVLLRMQRWGKVAAQERAPGRRQRSAKRRGGGWEQPGALRHSPPKLGPRSV